MYYQNYENYMRSVLGYPIENRYTYDSYNVIPEDRNYQLPQEIEEMYPEIYKKLMPLVLKECGGYSGTVTNEKVDSIVDKIYSNIEANNEIMININIDNRKNSEARTTINSKEQPTQTRRTSNLLLRDLIKILVLNHLLGGLYPNRPPIRPPFPNRPRDYNDYLKF